MPVSVIVGGQYGSEGKGKVAHFFAKEKNATTVVRVGGPNSGHTVVDENDKPVIFKHLSTASIIKGVNCVLTSGHYIDLDILFDEIKISGIAAEQLVIDPFAVIITKKHKEQESTEGLIQSIGSTGCGLGAAISERVARKTVLTYAKDIPELKQYVSETNSFLRKALQNNERVIIEGTQGFGLSLLHSNSHPFSTSRDTTASAFVSEAGLSPMDIDDVIMVIRSFPIRVAGNSGPIKNETTWEKISEDSGATYPFSELTSVSKKIRRVAKFDAEVVMRAISYNNPTTVVLNHVDYFDKRNNGVLTHKMALELDKIEASINRRIDFLGLDAKSLIQR